MTDQRETQDDVVEAPIYQIRLDLKDAHPPIWRRLLVPSDLTLDIVHHIIQVAMGWEDYHLHMFTTDDGEIGDVSRDDWGMVTLDEREFALSDVLERVGDKLEYEYDFGDSWRHVLKLEKILPADPEEDYPICVTGRRACPPEDVGGIWGYTDFLQAIADEANPDHGTWVEWAGEGFDPEAFDPDLTTEVLLDMMDGLVPAGPALHPLTTARWEMLSPGMIDVMLGVLPTETALLGPDHEELANRIRTAGSAADLLDLVPIGDPLLVAEWLQHITAFGPDSVALIAERLVEPGTAVSSDRARIQERLASALQHFGPPAVPALLEVFDRLDDFGKALACVALGQLGARESSDRIWTYFQRALMTVETGYLIGPMWALIDLGDPRAEEAVAQVLEAGWEFDELLAMAGRVGGRRALVPLFRWMDGSDAGPETQLGSALTLVAHRVGRRAVIEELSRASAGREPYVSRSALAKIADILLSRSKDDAEAAFSMMFTPMTAEDAIGKFRAMFAERAGDDEWADDWDDDDWDDDDWDDEDDAGPLGDLVGLTPRAAVVRPGGGWTQSRPGRNDPCWCGSGKKYKNCHWRSDQQKDIPQAA